eukprot:TRINITY_DN3023_c0_g2_i1.p1 TRINITY_DN3023_c0_g2~~TRINITY_DN3023_c0_g2_i1.p1  ORF type:complete len:879 (+),score=167.46 TRINITY_DN3023_c0_g2_i1:151-2787(+)
MDFFFSTCTAASAGAVSEEHLVVQHDRLRKLRDLDGATKIPFILVELRGVGDGEGYIEVCGKDEYGVYLHLEEWLLANWQCSKMDAGTLSDDTPLPFCDAIYSWPGFRTEECGTNNMGLASMRLIEYMTRELTWTLGVINGGNVGANGEIREQQIIFKAPHIMNRRSKHLMIELRSTGVIEVCGDDRESKDAIHRYVVKTLKGTAMPGHQTFCDRYYQCEEGIFREDETTGENNIGKMTVRICDAVVTLMKGWSLVTINGGNYGEGGAHREQQLVFRFDNHPLGTQPHFLLELREAGFVELNGLANVDRIHERLTKWLEESWGCTKLTRGMCDLKFEWEYKDMLVSTAEITGFFHQLGWQMQVCSQGTVQIEGNSHAREQQILFRPGASDEGHVEPHLFIELYAGEGQDALYEKSDYTQLLENQRVRIRGVGDCEAAIAELTTFLTDYMGGVEDTEAEVQTYSVDVFLSRGVSDNNLGSWTMRVCDFMVDRLGWSFVVCNVCNLGTLGNWREQQLVFRFDGERRAIPAVKIDIAPLDEMHYIGLQFPSYWISPDVLNLRQMVNIVPGTDDEIAAMQEIFDTTFKRALTRDRVYEYQLGVNEEMPYRLEVQQVFRSEHAELYRNFMERRSSYSGGTPLRAKTNFGGTTAKTLNSRLAEGEALLAHGTNPSSAIGILKTGFKLSAAGSATGTMFGYGIYLAECVSKSDEYSRDDQGGTYPGLMAILMCRCLVGKPLIVTEAGDHIADAREKGYDCVLGDRESKVGTYREFIFFDERQVMPEYAVIYKRQYDKDQVPESMRTPATGTTGRNWQVKLDKGWHNIPPNVSHWLSQAERSGMTEVEQTMGDDGSMFTYRFNLDTMEQTNIERGTVRKIRPPMRR